MLLRRLKYPRTTGLILRRTWPDLYKSHLIKLFDEFPQVVPWYNTENKEIRFPNGSRLFFGYAEHARDLAAFESSEFADIMPDEAQQFTQDELERLYAVNRCTTNPDITAKMLLTFMPGIDESGLPPLGLPYLKRVFVDCELEKEEQRREWGFLQAFSWDNIEWFRAELQRDGITEAEFYSWDNEARREYFVERTEYGAQLASMTNDALRDAWLYGRWDVYQGQYFSQFNLERHVISQAEAWARLKPWHTFWLSGDWGYDHPHAIYLHSIDENKRVTTFGELWGREVGEVELAKRIGVALGPWKYSSFAFSWDAGKLSSRSNPKFPKSISQLIADALPEHCPKPHPAESSPGSRVARARLMSQLLDSDMWQISEACEKLVAQIPTLVRDPDNTEDVLKVDYPENKIGDDCYDAASIGLQHMLGAAFKPWAVRREEALTKVAKDIAGTVGPVLEPVAARIHNAQFMTDLKMTSERRKQLTRRLRWRRG